MEFHPIVEWKASIAKEKIEFYMYCLHEKNKSTTADKESDQNLLGQSLQCFFVQFIPISFQSGWREKGQNKKFTWNSFSFAILSNESKCCIKYIKHVKWIAKQIGLVLT